MSKKSTQLGINYSTASGRLVKDILFKLIQETGKDVCYQCSGELNRESFSIEHKTPWLDSSDPIGNYFDLDNISFSHKSCNSGARRQGDKSTTRIHPSIGSYKRGCRCEDCTKLIRESQRKDRELKKSKK